MPFNHAPTRMSHGQQMNYQQEQIEYRNGMSDQTLNAVSGSRSL